MYGSSRKFVFCSPISPMTTGTAVYFEKILRRILSTGLVDVRDLVILTDSKLIDGVLPKTYLNVEVRDYKSWPHVVANNETWFLFLANNEFHAFAHEIIDDVRNINAGKVISIVHEPSNYMLIRHLSYNRMSGYNPERLVQGMVCQFGEKSRRLLHDADQGLTDNIFNHVVLAQSGLYNKSDEIWTHSRYAAAVLQVEYIGKLQNLPFKIFSHPKDDLKRYSQSGTAPREKFRIGIFGWISLAKRVREVLVGLRLALDRLDHASRLDIELIVVGKLPSDPNYNVINMAEFLHLKENVRFLGYQPDEEFEQLLATCSIVYNLRFPSCGETSGTINLAQGAGAKIVKTAYQAMHEEPAHEEITFLPFLESFAVASSICKNYENWKLGLWDVSFRSNADDELESAPIELGILEEILNGTRNISSVEKLSS